MEDFEANYTDGRALVYVLDGGDVSYIVASDFWPKEEQSEA